MSLAVTPAAVTLHHAEQLPHCPFPVALHPLALDLLTLAREHSQNPSQKIPVVGIAGCAGVGKTTITNLLVQQLKNEGISCVVVVHFDDWTNPREARQNGYFNLEGIHEFFKTFLKGMPYIEKPVYNGFTGEHSSEVVDMRSVDLILFEGLLALSDEDPLKNYFQYCDRGVFLEANLADIARWKRARPSSVQRTDEEFAEHMRVIFANYHEKIEPFKSNAAWIVLKGAEHAYTLEKSTL